MLSIPKPTVSNENRENDTAIFGDVQVSLGQLYDRQNQKVILPVKSH